MIRVLVVDDSAFMRKLISDFINKEHGMKAVETARNGIDALKKIKSNDFDVITLDVEMPVMDGIEMLRVLMKEHPLPVIMISSLTVRGAVQTLDALEAGAIDVVAKPSGSISLDLHKVEGEIVSKIRMAASVHVSKSKNQPNINKVRPPYIQHQDGNRLLAIGTSTGGPRALQHIIPKLQSNFNAPIFIVQHMPPGFTRSLADRLDRESSITVKEAKNGEYAKVGCAYIAPGGKQMTIKKIRHDLMIEVTDDPAYHGHCPSVDVLFSSLARLHINGMVGLILTGMGSDGAAGLEKIKKIPKNAAVVEAEETAVVYGMPKAAKERCAVDHTLRLEDIPFYLNNQFCK